MNTEDDGFRTSSIREVLNENQIRHEGCTFEYIPWKEVEKNKLERAIKLWKIR